MSGLVLIWLACPAFSAADQPGHTIPDPGYRPPNELAAEFVNATGSTRIAVLPTLVRRVERTAHSFASQEQIVAFLNESGIATATTRSRRIDLGRLNRRSQWDIFQYAAQSISKELENYETGADYILVMEILVPGDQAVFGVDVYIMDQQGRSVFSFLLNSHHELFADAKLVANDSSESSRQTMLENATRVGLAALKMQIEQARECYAASAETASVQAEAGILHDFQSDLTAQIDRYGTPLGFSTFSDGSSPVRISRSGAHPLMPDEAKHNTVMQLSLDVSGWGGVLHLFADAASNVWRAQDWSDLDGFSFWLYGNNSGTAMFVDLLDNRNPCSRRDDAERYTYEFVDDVAGWRMISVPFKDMARKEIRNGAPNDGLNLTDVHGWGLGTSNTNGPKTFYIDDFRLWDEFSAASPTPLAVITHALFIETRISEDSSRLVIEPQFQQGLVAEKAMRLQCAVASLTTERGYRYFRMDERAKLSGQRSSVRLTFYATPPQGMTVVENLQDGEQVMAPDFMSAAISAEEVIKYCRMMESASRNYGEP
jgi:hypothetical protein